MSKLFSRFAKDESGATAIEYGLMGSLIALAIIGAVRALGIRVSAIFSGITASI
jgi:pilus assembly protein Flp/PilA